MADYARGLSYHDLWHLETAYEIHSFNVVDFLYAYPSQTPTIRTPEHGGGIDRCSSRWKY